MVNKPKIIWKGSPNFGIPRGTKGRNGNKVIAIVDHIMQGTSAGTASWFANPASQASSHFGVGKDGVIHQYVELGDVAWANGLVAKPDWSLYKNFNPNYYTVSIEHEGYAGDVMPEAQYEATLALHRWLIAELGIPVTRDNIIGHYRIDSVNKAQCPGLGFPWDRLFKDLEGGGTDQMEIAVLYFSIKDFSAAFQIAERSGNCGMFCRQGVNANIHKDAKGAKKLIVVGGAEVTDRANVVNLCGFTGPDTAILAAQYAKTL